MTDSSHHPGRSVDFLSRLHDGDLEPGERARFESHRAHCAECRRAAEEFEDAMSLFRSTRSSPPRADLAARILRKVRTASPPRRFGLSFGMDLGWTALVVTALLALVVTTPIVVRRAEEAPPATNAPARRQEPAQDVVAPPAAEPPTLPARSSEGRDRRASARPAAPPPPAIERELARDGLASRSAAEAPGREPRIEAPVEARDERAAAAAGAEPRPSGSEKKERPAFLAKTAPLSLSISPIDGYGPPPVLVAGRRLELSVGERGREYALLVDSQGVVREITRHAAKEDAHISAPEALRQLRFQAGNRPRRLLVRIE